MAFLFRCTTLFLLVATFTLMKIANAQNIYILVKDQFSQSILPNSVYTSQSNHQIYPSNEHGYIILPSHEEEGIITHLGYESYDIRQDEWNSDSITVFLLKSSSQLKTINISGKKYRNKGNPAVELIKKVRAHQEENRPKEDYEYLSYQKYEKYNSGLMLPNTKIPKVPLLPKLNVFFEDFDSTKVQGFNLFPILIEENVFLNYFQKQPKRQHEQHIANKQIRFNEKYINNEHATQAFRFLYDNLDIYQSNIPFYSREIMSPLHSLGPQFYKYFIGDTLHLSTQNPIVQLYFEPRNQEDPLFSGILNIQLTDYAVSEAEINLSPKANINFIDEAKVKIYYQKTQKGYQIDESYSFTKFSLFELGMQAYLERSLILEHFNYIGPFNDSVFTTTLSADSIKKDYDLNFWEEHRPIQLTEAEKRHFEKHDSISNLKYFNRLQDWGSFLFMGYKQVGGWELGNINNIVNYNDVEGLKLSVNARTTPRWSPSWYLNNSLSYGFKDRQVKYRLTAIKSFNQQEGVFSFPHNYLLISYFNDIRFPGQAMTITDQSNILQTLRTESADRMLYHKKLHLSYVKDWNASFKSQLGLQHVIERPGGILAEPSNENKNLSYQYSSLILQATFAPGQEAIQQKNQRKLLPNTRPVFKVDLEWAPKNIDWNKYPFFSTTLSVFKRSYLGPFGQIDATLTMGKRWGTSPYTLMFTPSTNTSYFFNKNSFNLMNYSEFIADEFVNIKVEWQLDGLLFNKIPLLKLLKLREVIGVHGMAGQLSSHNNPMFNLHLPDFPLDGAQQSLVHTFVWEKPYIELNLGITNILRVIRVDFIKRLTHLRATPQQNYGIKFSLHFSI